MDKQCTIDFERGAKVAGSKFYFNMDARDEWSLITDMIDWHRSYGYKFIIPPYLINNKTMLSACPHFADELYAIPKDNLFLAGTAEHPLVGLHMDEIFNEDDLPIKYVAFSPCFRREAGAYGAKDKGLRRVHQFHKVELFVICKPQDSEALHQQMLEQVKALLTKRFGLEYRVIELSPEDRSPMSNKTYDIELKYEDEWLEVSSISNTGDNQSKIAQIRYRPKTGGKPFKCHLLNGSGVALPRLMLALSEKDKK